MVAPLPDRGDTPSGPASQRFLDAALELFVEHGFHGTSLQMIGDRLQVSKAAVTYHFKSKDALLAAIVLPALDDLAALLDEGDTIRRESARRTHVLHAYIDFLIRHRRVSTWLGRDIAAVAHPAVLEPALRLTGRIDTLLVSSTDDPEARIWGAAISQALTGPMVTANPADVSDDDLRRELTAIGDLLVRGYRKRQRRRSLCVAPER